jgi:calmodulin
MDDLPPRAATAPGRPRVKLTRTTLKRLTAIPPHKLQMIQRHYPIIPPPPGSYAKVQMEGFTEVKSRAQASDTEGEEPVEKLDANERRKRFLTTSNLKRVFRTLDLGEDGYIDVEELFEAQKRIGGKLTRQEVREVLWEVDDNMSGRLSLSDYLTTYKRSQLDESGFEPKRFYSIVEFLLMDRDCSGLVTLDEAMTTLFEREGAGNLGEITKQVRLWPLIASDDL